MTAAIERGMMGAPAVSHGARGPGHEARTEMGVMAAAAQREAVLDPERIRQEFPILSRPVRGHRLPAGARVLEAA